MNFSFEHLEDLVLCAEAEALCGEELSMFEEEEQGFSIQKTIFLTFNGGCSFSCPSSFMSKCYA